MSVTLINGEHHRNPSGCRNKVNWILSQCKHDRKAVKDLYSRLRNGELLCINNQAQHESWYDAFWIADWWTSKKFTHLPPSVLDKYHWLKAEYAMRKRLYRAVATAINKKVAELNDIHRNTAARMFHKKPEDVNDAERRLAKTINYGVMFGGFRDV